MFSYVASFVSKRVEHPVIFAGFILAALFLVASLLADVITGNNMATGFLFIYALMAAALGAAGYLVLFGSKLVSLVYNRRGSLV